MSDNRIIAEQIVDRILLDINHRLPSEWKVRDGYLAMVADVEDILNLFEEQGSKK